MIHIIILLLFGLVTFQFHFGKARNLFCLGPPHICFLVLLGLPIIRISCFFFVFFGFQLRESPYPSTCRLPHLHPTTFLGDTSELWTRWRGMFRNGPICFLHQNGVQHGPVRSDVTIKRKQVLKPEKITTI